MVHSRFDPSVLIEHALAPRSAKRYAKYAATLKQVTGFQTFQQPDRTVQTVEQFIKWAFEAKKSKAWAQAYL